MRHTLGSWNAAVAVGLLALLAVRADADVPSGASSGIWSLSEADAIGSVQTRAQQGDPQAEYRLGLHYDMGEGVPENRSAAFHWYKRAADAGMAAAEMNVAVMLDNGLGVKQDEAAAAVWYAKAAAHGDPRAAFDMGQLYESGEGVPRNPAAAAAWYAAAADHGVTAAAAQLKRLRQAAPTAARPAALQPVTLVAPGTNANVPVGPQGASAELVWTGPPEPEPVDFAVQVWSVERNGITPVCRLTLDQTATMIPLGPAPSLYAWRVDAQSKDGRHFAVSGLSWFRTASSGDTTAPASAGVALAR